MLENQHHRSLLHRGSDTPRGGCHVADLLDEKRLERVNGEIKRRTEVVGISPNEDAIVRFVGAILLETNVNGPSSAHAT
jgi:hypothetical protein